jgi:molybdate transport system substrate-binding protein
MGAPSGKMRQNLVHGIALAAVMAVSLSSCSRPAPPAATNEFLIVSAAASTKEVMEALAEQFKAETHTDVRINPGPSSGMANQILAGAPADLFLSASQQWADEVQKAGQAEAMARLLTNRLVVIVPKGNPGAVHEPKDFLSPKVKKIALAGEKVPAGMYADQALAKLGLLKQLSDEEKIARGEDVRTALAYVERGEAEAGVVYSTDVAVTPNVESVYQFDPTMHDEIVYALVLLKHANQNPAARQFYEYVQSPQADKVYTKFGFERLH